MSLCALVYILILGRRGHSADDLVSSSTRSREPSNHDSQFGALPSIAPALAKSAPCDERAPLSPEEYRARETRIQRLRDRTISDLSKQLAENARPAQRAIGKYLEMVAVFQAAMDDAQSKTRCSEKEPCEEDAFLVAERQKSPYQDAIARLAVENRNADVYAIAFYACSHLAKSAPAGQCAQLSARQWARLEPRNAVPWLFVAGEAAEQNQPALVEEAIYRAARADESNSHRSEFSGLLDSNLLKLQPEEVQDSVSLYAFGILAAIPIPRYQPVMAYCGANAVNDPNRRQVCDSLAEVMTGRADSMISLSLGIRIGERVGWPESRLQALRDRKDSFYQFHSDLVESLRDNCGSRGMLRNWFRDSLQFGEVEAVRREISVSGRTEAEMAGRFRAEQAARVAREVLEKKAKDLP